jgi:hypothetical protein
MQHAGTDGTLQLRHDRRWLTVSVRDDEPTPPVRRSDGSVHGLDVLDGLGVGWGCTPIPTGGKIVWVRAASRGSCAELPG